MSQNTIFKGTTTPVVIEFTGLDLTSFAEITVKFGEDERTKSGNPTSVIVNSATELELNFQDTTETLSNYWCIMGDTKLITNQCKANLSKTPICEGC